MPSFNLQAKNGCVSWMPRSFENIIMPYKEDIDKRIARLNKTIRFRLGAHYERKAMQTIEKNDVRATANWSIHVISQVSVCFAI